MSLGSGRKSKKETCAMMRLVTLFANDSRNRNPNDNHTFEEMFLLSFSLAFCSSRSQARSLQKPEVVKRKLPSLRSTLTQREGERQIFKGKILKENLFQQQRNKIKAEINKRDSQPKSQRQGIFNTRKKLIFELFLYFSTSLSVHSILGFVWFSIA